MIVCDRCIDKAQLFQWGSNSIQILEKCNLKEMYAMALQEYRANKPAFARDYAHLKLQQIIKALEKGARFPIQTR